MNYMNKYCINKYFPKEYDVVLKYLGKEVLRNIIFQMPLLSEEEVEFNDKLKLIRNEQTKYLTK